MCLAVLLTILAWTEGFESVPYFPPDHWIIVNADAYDAYWVSTTDGAHAGSRAAACAADFNSQNDDYLITPRVMPRIETGDTLLSCWVRGESASPCSIEAMISTEAVPAPRAFTTVATWPVSQTWECRSVSVVEHAGAPVYLAFRVRHVPAGQTVMLDDVSLPPAVAQPGLCNGRLRTRGDPAQQRLLVWGTHEERGFAHGFLLGEQCLANLTRCAIGPTVYHWTTPSQYNGQILPYFRVYFSIPPAHQEEAEGLYAGLQAKGVDLYHPALGRAVTVEDILCINALGDFQGFSCSSTSGWGESTAADDTLAGGVVIARNFEYKAGQHATLGTTSLILASDPSEAGEQRTASVTFAGYFACTSIINSRGVAAFINNGNHAATGTITPGSLIPFGLSLRGAVEDGDVGGVNDVASRIDHASSRYTYDVQIVSPFDEDRQTPATILELNNLADSLRYASDNVIAPAISSGFNLVVTNHHRVLYPPVACDRYASLACSLNATNALDIRRAFRLQDSVAWWMPAYLAGTLHSIAVCPNVLVEHPAWPCIEVSYANHLGGSHTRPRHAYSWEELFWRDGQAPAQVTGLSITPVAGDLLLSWCEPGDNVGTVEYRIYRSSAAFFAPALDLLAGSTSVTQWADLGAAAGLGPAFYRVAARDAALNEGVPSAAVGAMGFAFEPPVVSNSPAAE